MPDDETTETTTEETTSEETTTEETTTETPEVKEDELPEWARNELKKVRGEAAGYRVRLRDAEDKLKDAKTPEEFASALADIQLKNAELERGLLVTKVAAKHSLPPELAEVLKGDDEAALEAHAKKLAAFVSPSNPASLSGGLNPGESDDDFDPVKLAQEARRNRY